MAGEAGEPVTGPVFHVFVYGTLRSAAAGAGGRGLLRGGERVGEGVVRGTLYDLGDYPALLLGGGDTVRGEIWRFPTDRLPLLDRYEATEAGLFRRIAVEVAGIPCWVYVAGPRLGPRLTPEARVPGTEWRRQPHPS